jgi:hypothetical protein
MSDELTSRPKGPTGYEQVQDIENVAKFQQKAPESLITIIINSIFTYLSARLTTKNPITKHE